MKQRDTSMGGSREVFPDTPWSTVVFSGKPDQGEHLSELVSLYWRPVYRYARAAWGKTVEDAKDLTQAFFCHLIEDDIPFRHNPAKGRFRTFMKVALKNFLINVKRDASRLKRGGGKTHVSLDLTGLDADTGDRSPEELFDLQWARDVIAHTISRLKRDLIAEGKEKYFRAYELYELYPDSGSRPTYESVAGKLDLSPDDVKNYLTAARSRFHRLLAGQVRDYVTSREELESELRELFSGLDRG